MIERKKGERGRLHRGNVLESVRQTNEGLFWDILQDVRRLYMCYTTTERITQFLNRKWRSSLPRPVKGAEVSALINKRKWKAVRAKVEEGIVRGIQEKGAEIFGQIAFHSAEILKRGLASISREGKALSIKDMEQVSKIFERFDKVFRLEQDLPTEIIRGEVTKDKVIELIANMDYLEVGSVDRVKGLPGVGEREEIAFRLEEDEWEKLEREAEDVVEGQDVRIIDAK